MDPADAYRQAQSSTTPARHRDRALLRWRDPIAIHTLAAAAGQVTLDLIAAGGMEDQVLGLVDPGHKAEFLRLWHEAQNHFKHADRDPLSVLDYDPEHAEIQLLIAVMRYRVLATPTEAMLAFQAWWSLHHPDLLTDGPMQRTMRDAAGRLRPSSRAEFRRLIAEAANEMKDGQG
jgi:hypothetical protein